MIQENVKDKCKVNSESNQQSVGSKESNEKVLGVVTHQIDQTKLNSVVIQKGPSDAPSPVSDEGFPVYRHSLELISSSEDEDLNMKTIKTVEIHKKVVRSSSSDSAFSLEDDVVPPEEQPPPTTKRRATLTVTDIPLRAALLPVPEPILLPDVSTGSFSTTKCDHLATTVPSKTLIEARIVELPDVGKIDGYESTSRRESTQSFVSDTDGVRYVRTPSVVVSDYSDHDVLCGITLEEYEYFQKHKLRRASCSDCDHSENMSASSSCSNLDFCGSTISGLDGGDYYQSTISERKISDCSSCFTASDEELDKTTVATDDATWHKKKVSFPDEILKNID